MFSFDFSAQGDYANLLETLARREGLDLKILEQRQLAVNMLNGQLLLELTAFVKKAI